MSDVKPISDEELKQLPTNVWDFSPHDVWRLIARIHADAEKIATAIACLRQCEAGTIPFWAIADTIKALTSVPRDER